MQKRADGASANLKKITTLLDQWSAAVSSVAVITTELADEVQEFSKEDAYSNLVAIKFKEAALILAQQTDLLLKGAEQVFITPVQESVATYTSLCAKRSKWWNKADEHIKPIEDWYALRFDFFRSPFANFIGHQTLNFQNLSNVWTSLTATLEDKNFVGITENATAKDIVSTVEMLLSNPLSLAYFKKFLDQDLAAENLNFIMDVDAFAVRHKGNRTTFDDFNTHAMKIYTRYIANKSEQQVNLDYDTVRQLKENIENMTNNMVRDENLFFEGRRNILNLLATSVLPRFKASPLCQELYMTWRPVRSYNEEMLSNKKAVHSMFVPDVPPPTEPEPASEDQQAPSSPRNPLSLSQPVASPVPLSPQMPNPPSPRGTPTASPLSHSDPTTPDLRHSSSPPKHSPQTRNNVLPRSTSSPTNPGQLGSSPAASPTSPPPPLSQLSSQHRVKLVHGGPHNSPTPVFFQSRSSAVSIPRKSSSAGTLVESPPPQLLRSSTEDRLTRVKVPKRGMSAGAHIHSPFSFQTMEKIMSDPNQDATMFGSPEGLMSSRSEKSYHQGRPRATTNAVNSPQLQHTVVGRRNRQNGTSANSPNLRSSAGYDSEGSDLYESYGIAPRTSRGDSSDSLGSADLGESGELKERRISRGSSLDSFEMVMEKDSIETREKRVHSRSSSYDSGMAGSERSEEDADAASVPVARDEGVEPSQNYVPAITVQEHEEEPILPPPPSPPRLPPIPLSEIPTFAPLPPPPPLTDEIAP